jgi:hypothetical protein
VSKNRSFPRRILVYLVVIPAIALLVALTPLWIAIWLYYLVRTLALFSIWRHKHGRHGRIFLAVYSDSQKWESHFQNEIIPLLGNRAFVVNISVTPTWKASHSIERLAHLHWGGREAHTPIVIYFPHWGRVREVRLYDAYLALAKSGDESALHAQMQKLQALVT